MDEIRIKVKQDYMNKMKYKDICDKYYISMNTLKSWVSRNKWSDERKNLNKKGAHKGKRSAHKKQKEYDLDYKDDKIEYKEETEKLEDAALTDKQRLFCLYYIEDFNATKAYQKAYDCDRESARANSSRLLTNDNIKTEIDRLTEECLSEQEINSKLISKRVFQKHMDIAFADITDYVSFGSIELPIIDKNTNEPKLDENGEPITSNISYVDLKDSSELDGTIVSEVSKGKDGAKVKLHDKMKALQWLSDRMELLPTIAREKLEIEKEKLEMDKLRNSEEIEVFEDDGFIDALKGEISEVWADEDTEED